MTLSTALKSPTRTSHGTHTILNWSIRIHLVCCPEVAQARTCSWSQAASDLRLCLRLPFFFLSSPLLSSPLSFDSTSIYLIYLHLCFCMFLCLDMFGANVAPRACPHCWAPGYSPSNFQGGSCGIGPVHVEEALPHRSHRSCSLAAASQSDPSRPCPYRPSV